MSLSSSSSSSPLPPLKSSRLHNNQKVSHLVGQTVRKSISHRPINSVEMRPHTHSPAVGEAPLLVPHLVLSLTFAQKIVALFFVSHRRAAAARQSLANLKRTGETKVRNAVKWRRQLAINMNKQPTSKQSTLKPATPHPRMSVLRPSRKATYCWWYAVSRLWPMRATRALHF
jgi:hypothetical protein